MVDAIREVSIRRGHDPRSSCCRRRRRGPDPRRRPGAGAGDPAGARPAAGLGVLRPGRAAERSPPRVHHQPRRPRWRPSTWTRADAVLGRLAPGPGDAARRRRVAEQDIAIAASGELRYVGQFNEVEVPLAGGLQPRGSRRRGRRVPSPPRGRQRLPGTRTAWSWSTSGSWPSATPRSRAIAISRPTARGRAAARPRERGSTGEDESIQCRSIDGLAPSAAVARSGARPSSSSETTTLLVPPECRAADRRPRQRANVPQGRRSRLDGVSGLARLRSEDPPCCRTCIRRRDPVHGLANRLEAITREMGAAMLRSARSPIFAENRDFVTAIFDHRLGWSRRPPTSRCCSARRPSPSRRSPTSSPTTSRTAT